MRRILIIVLLALFPALSFAGKYYNGSAWVDTTRKYYNGSAWVDTITKRWNGTQWETLGVQSDSCTDGLVLSWHAENIDVVQGAPSGCSGIGDAVAALSGTATIASTDKSDGTNSLSAPAGYAMATFDPTTGITAAEGTVMLDVRILAYSSGSRLFYMEYNSTNYISLELSGDSDNVDIRAYYTGNGTTQSLYNSNCNIDINPDTSGWYRVKYQWKVAASAADHKIEVWSLDSASPREVVTLKSSNAAEDNLTAFSGEIDTVKIGASLANGNYMIDNVKIYSTSEL